MVVFGEEERSLARAVGKWLVWSLLVLLTAGLLVYCVAAYWQK